jgi:pimeloyl-ACP methyl ester carboxylesterase
MHALKPVISQFRRSFYIFCFLLPWPFSAFFASFGNYWFLRIMHSLSEGKGDKKEELLKRLSIPAAAEAMSVSTGPALEQLNSPTTNAKYGESVRRRVADRGMSQKIRLYRESLFLGPWEKSLELTAALFELQPSGGSSSPTTPKGALKAPATLLLGEYDLAFDRKLALDNIRDYLIKGSRVLLMKGGGHWLPTEPKGRRVIEEMVSGALNDTSGNASYVERGDVEVVAEA